MKFTRDLNLIYLVSWIILNEYCRRYPKDKGAKKRKKSGMDSFLSTLSHGNH